MTPHFKLINDCIIYSAIGNSSFVLLTLRTNKSQFKMTKDQNSAGSVKNQYIAAIVANIVIFNQGNAVGWVSPALITLGSDSSPLGAPLTLLQTSLIASSFCVGAIVGTPLFGWIVETLGRRKALLATSIPFLICWSIKIFWMNPYAIIFSRFIIGVGSAGGLLITPLYVSETASVNSRGTLGSFLTFSFNAGILFEYIIGAYMGYFLGLYILFSIPILSFLLVMRMPESPSDLVKAGKFKEAAEALGWLRSLSVESMVVKNELDRLITEAKGSIGGNDSIEDKVNPKREKVSSFRFLLNSPPSMRALALAASLLTAQCLMGIFAVLSYASAIFKESGSTLTPAMSGIIIGVLQLLGSFVASSLIDRLGRKIIFVCSCVCVIVAMGSLGTYFYVRDAGYDVSSLGWVPVLALSTAVCTFSMGAGPVSFILPSEVFMVQVRGLGTSICFTWLWIITFFIAQFFAPVMAIFGSHVVFWGFAFVGCIAIVISVVFQPETRGVPIEQTVAFFSGKNAKEAQDTDEEIGELFQKTVLTINSTPDEQAKH